MKGKKFLAVALASLMTVGLLSACGSSAESSSEAPASTAESTAESTTESTPAIDTSSLKIGVMLSGSANDGGWSQMGADAAAAAAEKYGCETNFSESIASTDYESVMRGYADAGYNIIVSHGAEFLDTAKLVGPDYPDTFFICTSAQSGQAPNVAGVDFATYQLGFLNGVACAMASESKKIGAVGSNEIDSIVAWMNGVTAGAKYIDPEMEVIGVYTGSYDDQLLAKQAVVALEQQGCDVITQNADACGIGAIQQCDEDGIKNVGAVSDQTGEGESCFISVIQDAALGITIAVEKAIEGTLPADANVMGADVGVITLSDYSGKYADTFTDEQKATLQDLWELSKTTDLATLADGSAPAAGPAVDLSNLKIGVMLSGSANDGGWSQMGATAAQAAADKYGCEANFSESLASTDYEAVMRGYADAGYSIIVSHGAEFLDTAKLVAPDYPDTFFICTSAQSGQAPNVAGVDFATFQLGFLNGVACAMASESKKIGAVGSNEIDSIVAWMNGVTAGAKYIDPEMEVVGVYTGSYDDQLLAKQAVVALEQQGCDVITQNADACGVGAIQQCDEDGIKNVGAVSDQTVEGDSCFISVIQDAALGITIAVEKAIEGTLPADANVMGADVGVITLSDYSGTYADTFSDEQKATLESLWELSKTTDLATLVD